MFMQIIIILFVFYTYLGIFYFYYLHKPTTKKKEKKKKKIFDRTCRQLIGFIYPKLKLFGIIHPIVIINAFLNSFSKHYF